MLGVGQLLGPRRVAKAGAMFLFERTLKSKRERQKPRGPARRRFASAKRPQGTPVGRKFFFLKNPTSLLHTRSHTSAFGAFRQYCFFVCAQNWSFLFWRLPSSLLPRSPARKKFPSGNLPESNGPPSVNLKAPSFEGAFSPRNLLISTTL